MMKFNSEQSGRSMVEMLGVLAIIGVLSVAGIAGYSKAMAKFKQSKLMDQVSMTAANIRTAYSGQPSYADLTTSVAQSLGLFDEMKVGTNSYKNSYGGTVGVTATSDNTAFELEFAGIPQAACVAIASADWGFGSGGLSGLVIGNGAPITQVGKLADVGTSCTAGGDNNTITWTYR